MCCTFATLLGPLRDYGLEPQVWDDPGDCEHEWVSERTSRGNTQGGPSDKQDSNAGSRVTEYQDRVTYSQFCQKCQAWSGSLGLEPQPDCGRPFMELKNDLSDKDREYVMKELKKEGLI